MEADFGSDGFTESVLAYLAAFDPQDPVTLILVLDPADPASPPLAEAQERVLHLAMDAGFTTFADIALVDQPQELLEILESHPHAQWIPEEVGTGGGLQGPMGWRLAMVRRELARRRPR